MASIKASTVKEVKEISEHTVSLLGMKSDVSVSAEEGHIKVSIDSEDSALLIGYRGESLFALRHILSLLCRESLPEGTSFTVDVGGYLKGREKRIEQMVEEAAATAKETGKAQSLPSMNAYERMIAHQKASSLGVVSQSEGTGQNRQVVISKE